MGKEIDAKSAVLIIVIIVLVAAAGYLTYMISQDENPLVLFNSRASEPDMGDPFDEGFDADQQDESDTDSSNDGRLLAQAGNTPTPTRSYTSTSPTPTGGILSGTPTSTASPTISLSSTSTPTPSTLPDTGGGNVVYATATPTPVSSLPVAGVGDYLPHFVGGGLILVVAALLL